MSVAAETLQSAMTLDVLLGRRDVPSLPVHGITLDSRSVREGDVFFACLGGRVHGLEHAMQAIGSGCAAIVFDPEGAPEIGELAVPLIAERGLREHLGIVADRFYGEPSRAVDVIGITGTNGKTTVAYMLADCLRRIGTPCAYSGTLGFGLGDLASSGGMTTPDVFEMHRRLAELRDSGVKGCAQEVSSHALDQGRVNGVHFKVAAFTNLSRDHLDYHETMEAYEKAKARLFIDYAPRIVVINIDTEAGSRIARASESPVVTVSMIPDADASLVIRGAEATQHGFELNFDSVYGSGSFHLPLLGAFNVENAAVVLGILLAYGVEPAAAASALADITPPPGRLELLPSSRPTVVVDYAHTPDALESALKALRVNTRGRLWCVFGCGGERDKGKRPLMAAVAERFADRVVVTSDNPRHESPEAIIEDIAAGFGSKRPAGVFVDRQAAIAFAIQEAADDDLVLIAGKGHETEQQIGDTRLPFSDVAVATAVLQSGARA